VNRIESLSRNSIDGLDRAGFSLIGRIECYLNQADEFICAHEDDGSWRKLIRQTIVKVEES
jgi:hypothetical protein